MTDIVTAFGEYYQERTTESIDRLFEAALEYDFVDHFRKMEEVARMRAQCDTSADETTELRSNGSSGGERRRYEFSPNFHQWAGKIEPFLRNIPEGKTIFLYCRLGTGKPCDRLLISESPNNKRHYETNGNFLDDRQLKYLFDFVDSIYEDHGKVNFSSFPDIWNILFSNPFFNHLCEDRRHKIGCFVNSDFEMLFGTDEFYVRDQMINWSSCLNFHTCIYGTKHFLPFFLERSGRCSGLINLKGEEDDSDQVRFLSEEPIACGCGSWALPMEIVPHVKNCILGPDGTPMDLKPLKTMLRGRYATIQIHQNELGEVVAFMTPVGSVREDDLDKIKSFFSGLKTAFEFDRYFEVGSKRYCFWRSEGVITKEFRLS